MSLPDVPIVGDKVLGGPLPLGNPGSANRFLFKVEGSGMVMYDLIFRVMYDLIFFLVGHSASLSGEIENEKEEEMKRELILY